MNWGARNDATPLQPANRHPVRTALRAMLRLLAGLALRTVCDLRIEGRENLPTGGPVIVVANHFHFADPVALLWLSRRHVEFIGGTRFVNAPPAVRFLPHLWGYIPAFRGGYSRETLRSALDILGQGGALALFPEGGSWAQVLRPARGGAAFLAVQSGAPVVPVGLDGFTLVFRQWRPRVTVRVGRPIGPFSSGHKGARRRRDLDAIGEAIMLAISELIPQERHGVYSSDPERRSEAEKHAAFPFEREGMRGI